MADLETDIKWIKKGIDQIDDHLSKLNNTVAKHEHKIQDNANCIRILETWQNKEKEENTWLNHRMKQMVIAGIGFIISNYILFKYLL